MRHLLREVRERICPPYEGGEADAVARLLLEDGLGVGYADALMREITDLSADNRTKLAEMCRRVAGGEPVQYVTCTACFCGLRLSVSPDVLIPRPETEGLVAMTAEALKTLAAPRVLDLGTGSGCIAIALKRQCPEAAVEAWDISEAALGVAAGNARQCQADVRFVRQDMLAAGAGRGKRFDLIVSNPPYVCESERKAMERHVLDHEPATALFVPDDDALRFYRAVRAVATESRARIVAVECNCAYAEAVATLFEAGGFAAKVTDDLFGRPRFVRATKK